MNTQRIRARRTLAHPSVALAVALLALGCTSDPEPCAPSDAALHAEVLPRLERYCGACHGERPDFGAPVSLVDADALLATRTDGTRLADRIAARILDGTMPPVGMPRLPDADADAIVGWATCGAADAPPARGLVSSAPPFLSPAEPPPGLAVLDLAANQHPVGPETRDEYRCFVIDADIPGDRFVRRFDMIYGETRVLHHLVLARDEDRALEPGDFDCSGGGGMPAGAQYLYAWAPGQSALEFPAGGLRVSPADRFVVQIHYNNGAAIPDVRDSSGVRLHLGPAEGPEYGMFSVGPMDFAIPPRARTAIEGRCVIDEPLTLLAGMPHMHVLGDAFEQHVVPAGGERASLIEITGWSFETQLFYALPATLQPGDVIETTCTYQNPGAERVLFGERTTDEMCQSFLYATPPPRTPYCDEGRPDRPTDVAYVPGECLGAGVPTDAPLVRGGWERVATPPALPSSASIPEGRWILEELTVYATGGETPVGAIDFDASYVLGRGQVITDATSLTYDVSSDNVVLLDRGTRFGGPTAQSFTIGLDATPRSAPLCPAGADPFALEWALEGDVLTLGFTRTDVPGQTLWPRQRFRREP